MSTAGWLAAAVADVERQGASEIIPILRALEQLLAQLRAADWNDVASATAAPPPEDGAP